jgi:hypothetical protein
LLLWCEVDLQAGGERALEKREGRREIPAAFGVLALSW